MNVNIAVFVNNDIVTLRPKVTVYPSNVFVKLHMKLCIVWNL